MTPANPAAMPADGTADPRLVRGPSPPEASGERARTKEVETLGSSILQSLAAQAPAPASVAVPPGGGEAGSEGTAATVREVGKMMAEMADAVLVSDPIVDGRREVRLRLSGEFMAGTEIRMWRAEGKVHVVVETPRADWGRTLTDAVPLLTDRLDLRLAQVGGAVITVRTPGDGGLPEDGRSRQQHGGQPSPDDDQGDEQR